MSDKVTLVIALHNHQPVGNFDFVFEEATQKSYAPFLEALKQNPNVRISQHYSGPLLEWFENNKPKMLDAIGELVNTGQIELMGGPFYEPVLSMLSEQDRQDQLGRMSDYLKKHFGVTPLGAWTTERVWEQNLTQTYANAGIKYTTLDDSHFRAAGIRGNDLHRCFLTEDSGELLRVYPIAEMLRYYIPFHPPEELIAEMKKLHTTMENAVFSYADDGEKFGVWPETYEHVYTNGWLKNFFKCLEDNSDWLEVVPFSDTLKTVETHSTVYLPDASYREMMEWSLPSKTLAEHNKVHSELITSGLDKIASPFMRGGTWRNFKIKYYEAAQMYARTVELSKRVHKLKGRSKYVLEAKKELHRSQCNCAYWHGCFGGLYLPHLRTGIYKHILAGENACDKAEKKNYRCADFKRADFNLDGANEIKLHNADVNLYFDEANGGMLYEYDLRKREFNTLNALNRRYEAYHEAIINPMSPESVPDGQVASIHDIAICKDANLDEELAIDTYRHGCFVDHFLEDDTPLNDIASCKHSPSANFNTSKYTASVKKKKYDVAISLERIGDVLSSTGQSVKVKLTKTITLSASGESISAKHTITNLSDTTLKTRFGVEFCFSLLAGDAPDRYYYTKENPNLGPLITKDGIWKLPEIGMRDEWSALDIKLKFSEDAGVYIFPIRTVSASESGFELLYQSSIIIPTWDIELGSNKTWKTNIEYIVGDVQ